MHTDLLMVMSTFNKRHDGCVFHYGKTTERSVQLTNIDDYVYSVNRRLNRQVSCILLSITMGKVADNAGA